MLRGTSRRYKIGYGLATAGSLFIIAILPIEALDDLSDAGWGVFGLDLILWVVWFLLFVFFAWRFRQSFH